MKYYQSTLDHKTHKENEMKKQKTLAEFKKEARILTEELHALVDHKDTLSEKALVTQGMAEKIRDAEQKLYYVQKVVNFNTGEYHTNGHPIIARVDGVVSTVDI